MIFYNNSIIISILQHKNYIILFFLSLTFETAYFILIIHICFTLPRGFLCWDIFLPCFYFVFI
ncbi:hypothetical protein HMPREF3293_01440 [Christensenella minuta]|uniref:Uncharacterized protein n=1 Tax=Christensenella minuta TaxID=626937 RepID=A0A136Q4V4_9FIRM|nr:hypothetical protein HMPREF3293_01440 [Christensenella minuta]